MNKYKPLSDEQIKELETFYNTGGTALLGVSLWIEQCRRANALAAAVRDIRDSDSGTKSLKPMYEALRAYLGGETP